MITIPADMKDDFEIRNGEAYYKYGNYYIENSLWNKRIAEGRRIKFDHDFVNNGDLPDRYGCVGVTCKRCGETRSVLASLDIVNATGYCTPYDGYRLHKDGSVRFSVLAWIADKLHI